MASDQGLITGAAAAYKDWGAASLKKDSDALFGGVTESIDSWIEGKKQAHLELKRKQEQAGVALNKMALDMAPHHKALGEEAYNIYKDEIYFLREEMNEAIKNGDQDEILRINMELGQMGTSAANDKDAHESLIEGWEGSEHTNGEPLYDVAAMTPEGLAANRNFLSNPTKRFIRTSNGESAYTWEVPKMVDGEEVLDANGNPEMETQTYTLEQLHDFTVMPATKSGMGYMDLITEKKQLFTDTQGEIKIEDIRSKVDKIIPKDVKGLRSWAYSNPTDNSDLDIKGYLLDHPLLNKAAYKDLGVQDNNNDQVIDENDLVSDDDKEKLIDAIMNAENPAITHEILTDIFTHVGYNNIHNIEYKENTDGTYEGNKDYTPDDSKLMGGPVDVEGMISETQQAKIDGMKDLRDNGAIEGENMAQIKSRLGLSEEDMKSGIMIDGKLVMPESWITPAIQKAAIVAPTGDMG